MKQLSDERTMWKTKDEIFVVTTHRVRLEAKYWGQARVISIMLEELCSCEIKYASYPWLIIFAIGVFLIGISVGLLLEEYVIPLCIGGGIGIFLIIVYFQTRHQILLLSSASGSSIRLDTLGWGLEKTKELVDIIERAKNNRYIHRLE